MAYTPVQWRAIERYSKVHSLKPMLSAYPHVSFVDAEGEEQTVHISSLVDFYQSDKKQESLERARLKRLERKGAK